MVTTRRATAAVKAGTGVQMNSQFDGDSKTEANPLNALLQQQQQEDGEELPDRYGFREHQRQWFRRVMRKTTFGMLCYVVLLMATVALLPHTLEVGPPGGSVTFAGTIGPLARIAGTAVCTFVACATFYIDIVWATPPDPNDSKWFMLKNSVGGHFSYLTFTIIVAHLIYWPCCLIAELGWYLLYHEDARAAFPGNIMTSGATGDPMDLVWTPYLLNLLLVSYSLCVFSSTLGAVLGFLFLKFNWYEPAWRRDVLEVYYARGQHSFATKALFNHLNQLPLAVIDVLVLKDDTLLRRVGLSPYTLLAVVALYMAVYVAWTHLNFRVNGGHYPYPIFAKIFASWKIELSFLAVVSTFVFCVSMIFHWLAIAL